jgi:hypothetical protein
MSALGPGADISLAKVCERGSEAFPATAAALRKPTGSETLALDRARRHDPRGIAGRLTGETQGKIPRGKMRGYLWQRGAKAMSIFGSIMGAIFGHGSAQASASPTAPPSAPPAQTVDVATIVDKAAAAKGEKLAWRTSIVDLMKALNLDSSLNARKELAKELKYTGDTNDSATMNVWLHKQIMMKLAANGGKLPSDIKA